MNERKEKHTQNIRVDLVHSNVWGIYFASVFALQKKKTGSLPKCVRHGWCLSFIQWCIWISLRPQIVRSNTRQQQSHACAKLKRTITWTCIVYSSFTLPKLWFSVLALTIAHAYEMFVIFSLPLSAWMPCYEQNFVLLLLCWSVVCFV